MKKSIIILFLLFVINNFNKVSFKKGINYTKKFYQKNRKIINSIFAVSVLGAMAYKIKNNYTDNEIVYVYDYDFDDNLVFQFNLNKLKDLHNRSKDTISKKILNIIKKTFKNLNIKQKNNDIVVNHLGNIDVFVENTQEGNILTIRFKFIYLQNSFMKNVKNNNIINIIDYEKKYLNDANVKKNNYNPTIGFDYFKELTNTDVIEKSFVGNMNPKFIQYYSIRIDGNGVKEYPMKKIK